MKNKNASIKAKAFTLIELLVVIAIIALLMAILVPGLKRARGLAHRIVCGSHIKNIATASYTYATTFGDYFVPASVVGPGQPAKMWPRDYDTGDRYWYENKAFRKYLDIDAYIDSKNLATMPKEFLCPADRISRLRTDAEDRISYAYNNSDWRPWTHKYTIVGYKVTTVTRPAETLNFIDSITHDVDLNGAHYKGVWDRIKGLAPDPTTWPDPRTRDFGAAHYRHNEGANVGFYDGHAQWLKKEIIFDIHGYYANPTRTGMWTASGKMIPGWFMRFSEQEFRP